MTCFRPLIQVASDCEAGEKKQHKERSDKKQRRCITLVAFDAFK